CQTGKSTTLCSMPFDSCTNCFRGGFTYLQINENGYITSCNSALYSPTIEPYSTCDDSTALIYAYSIKKSSSIIGYAIWVAIECLLLLLFICLIIYVVCSK